MVRGVLFRVWPASSGLRASPSGRRAISLQCTPDDLLALQVQGTPYSIPLDLPSSMPSGILTAWKTKFEKTGSVECASAEVTYCRSLYWIIDADSNGIVSNGSHYDNGMDLDEVEAWLNEP
jgi:hypothetical protein